MRRCFLKEGDKIVFKKPRKNKVTGTVVHIERDLDKVIWGSKDRIPFYISVATERHVNGKVLKADSVKTYESKIRKVN